MADRIVVDKDENGVVMSAIIWMAGTVYRYYRVIGWEDAEDNTVSSDISEMLNNLVAI